ncbi:MAG: trypsin-like peptidase domain-containing protein [Fuerstiella sp.]|nr:trypsin-like peptidase domain-containing protein [Fuerstiella sp.]
MKQAMVSFVFGLSGALWAMWLVNPTNQNVVHAQRLTHFTDPLSKTEQSVPRYNADGLTNEEAVNAFVYSRNNRGVVNITTRTVRNDGLFLFESSSEGAGSGAIIDKAGHVLTNYHVVEDARQVKVTLYDGKTYVAALVGADPVNDTAVIKIDASPETLFPIELGDSGQLKVGMRVFAIGNPFGLERTMTTGIISSLNRSLQITRDRSIKSIIQVDAAVNPGNSGGPLLDSHGRLIGVNTAIASHTGQNSGIGFAIPASLINRVVPQLIRHGRVIRPDIGIQVVYETDDGLLVIHLTPGGPAEQAGLRGPRVTRERRGPIVIERTDRSAADMIVAVDGQPIRTADEFLGYIESNKPGDRVIVTVIRGSSRLDIPVHLDETQS